MLGKILILIFVISFGVYAYSYTSQVIFLDVGQGDGALIKTPNRKIVIIDGGPDWQILYGLGKYLKPWQRNIDAMFISHFHHDHFIGLAEVLERYKVKKIYYFSVENNDSAYKQFLDLTRSKSIEVEHIVAGDIIYFDINCFIKTLWPTEDRGGHDLNRLSLVLKLECNDQKFLFTGDVDKAVEEILITLAKNLKSDVLKSPHHGSNSSNSFSFLQAVNPNHFVISAKKDNKYGLPSAQVISRINELNIRSWQTGLLGDAIFSLNLTKTLDK